MWVVISSTKSRTIIHLDSLQREVSAHGRRQGTAFVCPSWAVLQRVLRRVLGSLTFAAPRSRFRTYPAQELTESSVPGEHLREGLGNLKHWVEDCRGMENCKRIRLEEIVEGRSNEKAVECLEKLAKREEKEARK